MQKTSIWAASKFVSWSRMWEKGGILLVLGPWSLVSCRLSVVGCRLYLNLGFTGQSVEYGTLRRERREQRIEESARELKSSRVGIFSLQQKVLGEVESIQSSGRPGVRNYFQHGE